MLFIIRNYVVGCTILLAGCAPVANRPADAQGQFPLHLAVREGDTAALPRLFEEGANANVADLSGLTPLHLAARQGNTEAAELLLRYHAQPDVRTDAGWTALQLALWKGHEDTAEVLLRYGASPEGRTPEGYHALHLAAMSGAARGVDMLFRDWKHVPPEKKPKPDAKGSDGKTAMDWALEREHEAVVSTLLLRGADPLARDADGNTLLHRVAGTGKISLANTLISAGVPMDATNNAGLTAMELALQRNDSALAEWLQEYAYGK